MLQWIFSGSKGRRVVKAGPGLWERRKDYRLRCRFEATCQSAEQSVNAHLVEIGPRGLRIETDAPFKPGTSVRVSCRPGGMLLGRQRLPYRVTWCEPRPTGCEVGVTLEGDTLSQTWVEYALKLLGALRRRMQPRRAFRAPFSAPAELRDLEGAVLGLAQLRDIGMQGAMISTPVYLEPGGTVRFALGPTRKMGQFEVPASILSSRRDTESCERLAHLRFFGLNDSQNELLEKFVLSAIEQMEP